MMEKYPYGAKMHNMAKLISRESFPLRRSELEAKYGDARIGVDFDRTISFREALELMGMEEFPTAVAFYAAIVAKL